MAKNEARVACRLCRTHDGRTVRKQDTKLRKIKMQKRNGGMQAVGGWRVELVEKDERPRVEESENEADVA